MEIWREYAKNVDGRAVPCGHYIPEEAPGPLLERVEPFFRDTP